MESKISMLFTAKTVFIIAFLIVYTSSLSISRREQMTLAEDSCSGRCNQTGTIPNAPCQCNSACIRYNDCCVDYFSLCLGQTGSCVGRCDQQGTVPGTCQCNKPCVDFGDCCPDYVDVCAPSGVIPDNELEALAEELISMDTENNATQFITVDLQGKTSSDSNNDMAPNLLLTVSPSAFSRPTIQKLMALHDNYNPDTTVRESHTPQEEEEINSFIDAIFRTKVMQTAQEFLVAKNLPNGRESFYELWFELYSRGNGIISSSGFEHVFVGELQRNAVSGFHNWEHFAAEENQDRLNYMGYMDFLDLGQRGSIIEHSFEWKDERKPISSMFIGTSPELELAIYTVCFHARPDSKCPISLNGSKVKIQTYTIGSRDQYVATAYPDLSDNERQ